MFDRSILEDNPRDVEVEPIGIFIKPVLSQSFLSSSSIIFHRTLSMIACENTSLIFDVIKLLLFAVGIPSNIAFIFLVRRRKMRSRSFAMSLIVYSIVNTCAILITALQTIDNLLQMNTYGSIETSMNAFACKIYRYIPPTIQVATQWMTVLITSQLFMAICYPFLLKKLFNYHRTRFILVGLLVAILATQVWRLYIDTKETNRTVNISESPEGGTFVQNIEVTNAYCSQFQEYVVFYMHMDYFFHLMVLVFFLPVTLIFSMDVAVLAKLFILKHKHNNYPVASHALAINLQAGTSERKSSNNNDQTASAETNNANHESNLALLIRKNQQPHQDGTFADRRIKSTFYLLTAVALNFFICVLPQLALGVFIHIYQLVYGGDATLDMFDRVCNVLNAASVLTCFSWADNLVIFAIASDKLRLEIKHIFDAILSTCSVRYKQKTMLTSSNNATTNVQATDNNKNINNIDANNDNTIKNNNGNINNNNQEAQEEQQPMIIAQTNTSSDAVPAPAQQICTENVV